MAQVDNLINNINNYINNKRKAIDILINPKLRQRKQIVMCEVIFVTKWKGKDVVVMFDCYDKNLNNRSCKFVQALYETYCKDICLDQHQRVQNIVRNITNNLINLCDFSNYVSFKRIIDFEIESRLVRCFIYKIPPNVINFDDFYNNKILLTKTKSAHCNRIQDTNMVFFDIDSIRFGSKKKLYDVINVQHRIKSQSYQVLQKCITCNIFNDIKYMPVKNIITSIDKKGIKYNRIYNLLF